MPRTEIKGVLFDLFGTLIITPTPEAVNKIIDHLGIYPGRDQLKEWLVGGFPMALLLDKFGLDFTEVRDFLLTHHFGSQQALINLFKNRYNIEIEIKEIEQIETLYNIYISGCKVVPQLFDLILRLRRKGISTALVTNVTQQWLPLIDNHPFKECFDVFSFSCFEGAKKPDPGIFRSTLQKMNLKPSEVIMVGDNFVSDILGAKNVGIETIWFSYKKTNADQVKIISEYYNERAYTTVSGFRNHILSLL